MGAGELVQAAFSRPELPRFPKMLVYQPTGADPDALG